jgi:protease YdgD
VSRSLDGWLTGRAAVRYFWLITLVSGLVAGCAPKPPVTVPIPAPVPQALPWTAAVGQLVFGQGDRPCTAVLVAPDTIVTAAHCLFQGSTPANIQGLVFHLNYGARPDLGQFRGRALRALGGEVRQGRINHPQEVASDWALLYIDPPVEGVAPVPVATLTTPQILEEVNRGASLFTAGYGYGAQKQLRPHWKCSVVNGSAVAPADFPGMLVTNCIIRIGDSGGPIALLDAVGKPQLIGIFSGLGVNGQTGLSFGANASNFARYLDTMLISQSPGF